MDDRNRRPPLSAPPPYRTPCQSDGLALALTGVTLLTPSSGQLVVDHPKDSTHASPQSNPTFK